MARRSPLYGAHVERGATFVDVGGWLVPSTFDGSAAEYAAVRESAGAFDRSHRGRVAVAGPDATALVSRLSTNDPSVLAPGEGQATTVTDDRGVVVDDALLVRVPAALATDRDGGDADGGDADPAYRLALGGTRPAAVVDRLTAARDDRGLDATVADVTDAGAVVAVHGPDATTVLATATPAPVARLSWGTSLAATVAGVDCLVTRLDVPGVGVAFETSCPAVGARAVWDALVDAGARPCGREAGETLRLEAGVPSSGTEFDPVDQPRTPYEVGLGALVKLDHEFVGRDALERVAVEGVSERLAGLRPLCRAAPGPGAVVVDDDGAAVGTVTSGGWSPALDAPVALGYLPVALAVVGGRIGVRVGDAVRRATVAARPFVDTVPHRN